MGFFHLIIYCKWLHMIGKVIHIARILSIDIAVGACICTLFVAKYLQVKLPFLCVLALGICVWLIYTADHLIDAWKVKHHAHSERHYFHQKHFKSIVVAFVLLLLCSSSFLFLLPKIIIQWGMILLVFVMIYFLLMTFLRPSILFQKEGVAAILYASGVFLAPLGLTRQPITTGSIIIFLQFLGIVYVNLIAFSLFEKDLDETDGHYSFVKQAGVKFTRQLLIGLSILVIVSILVFMLYLSPTNSLFKVEILWLGMSLTMFSIVSKPSAFEKHDFYRIIGDGIFFYPLVMLFF